MSFLHLVKSETMQSSFFYRKFKNVRFNLYRAVVPLFQQKVQNHNAKFVLKFNTFFNQYETMMEHFCKVSEFFETLCTISIMAEKINFANI